ncbi:MAG: hypothetical protein P1P64_04995 [Treponemataceae bacterium]
MSRILNRGEELIRISPKDPKKIEYSIDGGSSWSFCYSGNSAGKFMDLIDNGKEILATTEKGLYYSINEGRSWSRRG